MSAPTTIWPVASEEMTKREKAIYQRGFNAGMDKKADDIQPTITDLELRLLRITELLRDAIGVAHTSSF